MTDLIGERTIIYPGSFDPIHNGHIALTEYVSQQPGITAVWLMPSRRNPLKTHDTNVSDSDRIAMARLSVATLDKVEVKDLELHLPFPSYTINTLHALQHLYPTRKFAILIGADNWRVFHVWRNWQEILTHFGVIIYPRPGYMVQLPLPAGVEYLPDAPQYKISSTQIRNQLHISADTDDMIPMTVRQYIHTHQLYLPHTQ